MIEYHISVKSVLKEDMYKENTLCLVLIKDFKSNQEEKFSNDILEFSSLCLKLGLRPPAALVTIKFWIPISFITLTGIAH